MDSPLQSRVDALASEYRGTLHAPLVGLIIKDGVVKYAAVIPDHHVTDRPAMAKGKMRLLAMAV